MRNFILIALLLSSTYLLAQQTAGVASYYAPGFHGKRTSVGEIYDHSAFTCANKEFPVNTVLKVIRVDDGRSVNVRVNDCGPFKRGRIIDLSGAAAEQIGLIRDGITQVRVEVVKLGTGRLACGGSYTPPAEAAPSSYGTAGERINTEEAEATEAPAQPPVIEGQGTFRAEVLRPIESGFGVQIGSYRVYENAAAVATDLQSKGYSKVLIRLQGNVHQVILGPFETRDAADVYRSNLRAKYGMRGFITEI